MAFRAYELYSCGDNAITADFGNVIDPELNEYILTVFEHLIKQPLAFIDIVPAYSSITFYYDIASVSAGNNHSRTAFNEISNSIHELLSIEYADKKRKSRMIEIPVCYENEFSTDAGLITSEKKITVEELVSIHTSKSYRVYMLGFLPGFAYMGDVDDRIAMRRKDKPQQVPEGSVGIADKQTGIYPFSSPGGWNIIGRTPLRMFNPAEKIPTLLKPGDEIKFVSIDKELFMQIHADEYQGY